MCFANSLSDPEELGEGDEKGQEIEEFAKKLTKV